MVSNYRFFYPNDPRTLEYTEVLWTMSDHVLHYYLLHIILSIKNVKIVNIGNCFLGVIGKEIDLLISGCL